MQPISCSDYYPHQNSIDLFLDDKTLAKNLLHVVPRLHSLDHRLECIDQLENSNLAQPKRLFAVRRRTSCARENAFLFELAQTQLRSRFLEFFVFDLLPN